MLFYFLLILINICYGSVTVSRNTSIALVCVSSVNETVNWDVFTASLPFMIVSRSQVRFQHTQNYNHYNINGNINILEIRQMNNDTIGKYRCLEENGFGIKHKFINVRLATKKIQTKG